MPDETRPKHPMPKIPDVASFMRRFGENAACAAYLRETRWGANLERFTCPDCGHPGGWWLPTRGLVECRDCHHQTSPTAGTAFHGARVPLWKWFWAMYQEAHSKKGIAAMALDGAEGDTSIVDYAAGGTGKTLTVNDTARLTKAQSRFGPTSLYLDGGGAHVKVNACADWRFGTAPWTIDLWTYVVEAPRAHLLAWYANDANLLAIERVSAQGEACTLRVRYRVNGVDLVTATMPTPVTLAGGWHHIALVRTTTALTLYIDGVVACTATIAAGRTFHANAWPLYLGHAPTPTGTGLARGHLYIDAVRVSRVARWSGAFSPPSNQYTGRLSLQPRGSYMMRTRCRVAPRGGYGIGLWHGSLSPRGGYTVLGRCSQQPRGGYHVYIECSQSPRGGYGIGLHRCRIAARGAYRIRSACKQSPRGGFAIADATCSLSGRGVYRIDARCSIEPRGGFAIHHRCALSCRGAYGVEDDTLEGILVYYALDQMPDLEGEPTHESSTLYFSFIISDRLAGKHYVVLRRRNRFGRISQNRSPIIYEVDAEGNVLVARPSGPQGAGAAPAADADVRIVAGYVYGADDPSRADTWQVYVRHDGTDPDPDIDTPTEIPVTTADGVATLDWLYTQAAHGDTVKTLVRLKRSGDGRDDGNTTVMETVANSDGPGAVAPKSLKSKGSLWQT